MWEIARRFIPLKNSGVNSKVMGVSLQRCMNYLCHGVGGSKRDHAPEFDRFSRCREQDGGKGETWVGEEAKINGVRDGYIAMKYWWGGGLHARERKTIGRYGG